MSVTFPSTTIVTTVTTTATGDLTITNVVLQLHGDGIAASTNSNFVDASTNTFVITRVGTPTQGAVNPFGSNWSAYFNGSTDYLTSAGQIANFGTGNFTIDCWFNVNNTSAAYIIYDARSTGVAVSIDLYLETGTGYNLKVYTNNAQLISATSLSISAGIWYHTALVRNSGITTLYVNGTSIASV
jgi:hypothetical protein